MKADEPAARPSVCPAATTAHRKFPCPHGCAGVTWNPCCCSRNAGCAAFGRVKQASQCLPPILWHVPDKSHVHTEIHVFLLSAFIGSGCALPGGQQVRI